jgi:hypothetical protein
MDINSEDDLTASVVVACPDSHIAYYTRTLYLAYCLWTLCSLLCSWTLYLAYCSWTLYSLLYMNTYVRENFIAY